MSFRVARCDPKTGVIVTADPPGSGDSMSAIRFVAMTLEVEPSHLKLGPPPRGAAVYCIIPDPDRQGAPARFANAVENYLSK